MYHATPSADPSSRRSFATYLKRARVDEDVRKRLIGHRLGDVTEEFYTAPEEAPESLAAISKVPLVWRDSSCQELPEALPPGSSRVVVALCDLLREHR